MLELIFLNLEIRNFSLFGVLEVFTKYFNRARVIVIMYIFSTDCYNMYIFYRLGDIRPVLEL